MKTYSVKQIAEMLNTNPETVRRWIRSGRLNAVQTSRKGGNVVTEAELDRFRKATPKYLSKVALGTGFAVLSPIGGIGVLAGSIAASAFLKCCEEKSNADVRIQSEDFKNYLKNNVAQLNKTLEYKKELIKQTETEIEDISRQIDQYAYLLEHEDILQDSLENANGKGGDGNGSI